MLYRKILEEKEQNDDLIKQLTVQLKHYPKGEFYSFWDRKWTKWFIDDGTGRKLIPKSARQRAEKLAMKKYLSYALSDAYNRRKAIEAYLKFYNPEKEKSAHLLDNKSAYKELLSPYIKSNEDYIKEWECEEFSTYEAYPEHMIHKTLSGYNVRSKSESMIERALCEHNIPHRYECEYELSNGIIVHPDFTMLHPETRKIYMWEHCGRMDDEQYARKTIKKINEYVNDGWLIGVNMIMTFETYDKPLTADMIETTIQCYFG